MKTGLPDLIQNFNSANAALARPAEEMLRAICDLRALHARFLNTLAMLEHMGSHKIMATQHGPAIDQPTLKHLAEEARHAFFFKRVAEREAGRPLGGGPADLLAPLAARRYFNRLEAQIVRAMPPHASRRAAYLLMSMVVEFRATWIYGIYQSVLAAKGHTISLKSLLAEEQGHLDDMAERLAADGQFDASLIRELCAIETGLYRDFIHALDGVLARERALLDASNPQPHAAG